ASQLAYASADARTGHRLRTKLLQTIRQKWANFSTFESSACDWSALSSHNACAPSRILRNLETLFAMPALATLSEQSAKRKPQASPTNATNLAKRLECGVPCSPAAFSLIGPSPSPIHQSTNPPIHQSNNPS